MPISCQQPPLEIHGRHIWPRPGSNYRWVLRWSHVWWKKKIKVKLCASAGGIVQTQIISRLQMHINFYHKKREFIKSIRCICAADYIYCTYAVVQFVRPSVSVLVCRPHRSCWQPAARWLHWANTPQNDRNRVTLVRTSFFSSDIVVALQLFVMITDLALQDVC